MNLKIGRKVYDTEKSRLIAQKACGCYGDPTGYEEVLYQKAENDYFFFGQGGSKSPYQQSTITPVTIEQAKVWLIDVIGASAASVEFPTAAKASAKKPAAVKTVKPASKKATKKA